MIKSLFNNENEESPPEKQAVAGDSKETSGDKDLISIFSAVEGKTQTSPPAGETFEIPEDARAFAQKTETPAEQEEIQTISRSNAPPEMLEPVKAGTENAAPQQPETMVSEPAGVDRREEEKVNSESLIFQSEFEPQSKAETLRQSGLAYSAAVVMFGSIVLMLVFGWLFDLLVGSSPWGIVGGIVLGAIIGFVQLFRITSQIFKR